MVKAEGWDSKTGSKWKTMPEQMFKYRAAAFWQRAYAPEISMGLQTAEEAIDIAPTPNPGTVSLRFTDKQMNNAKQEIRERVATVGTIKEKFPTLIKEQVDELQKVEDAL